MVRVIILLIASVIASNLSAQTAKGLVFKDINANGKLDKGENGIPDVGVSNGRDVVLTDKNGHYSIEAPDNSVIFVIKPPQYRFLLDNYNLPQFYYLHNPQGSQALKLSGLPPSGPLPGEINFGLIPAREDDNFKALIFGDTQVRSLEQIDYLGRDIIAESAVEQQFAFAAVLGDLVFDKPELYKPLNQVMAALGKPMFNVPGNHDINFNSVTDNLANSSYQGVYGPKTYAFNYGQVHFIALDDIIYSGDTVKRRYEEGFDDDVLSFISNDLKYVPEEKLIVLMMHAPFINGNTQKPITNLDKILAELDRFPHTFSISGHDHKVSQQILTTNEGWNHEIPHHHFNTGTVCGNWWQGAFDEQGLPDAMMNDGTPNGYSIVSFTGNSYIVDYKVARRPADYQMNIFTPAVIKQKAYLADTSQVTVNFFTGSGTDKIIACFDGGEWAPMTYAIAPDPIYEEHRKQWEKSTFKMPASNSMHLWNIAIPGGLTVGFHKVEVEATDIFGLKHKAIHFFRVEE